MSRADLLALTTEALVRLANVGLVKRARKELADGVRPAVVEDADATVVATARDGAITRLPRGVALQQTSCTCGASQVCRHRIAAVLAYQAAHTAEVDAQAWDPGAITDDAILRCCSAPIVARAGTMIAHGVVITTRAGPPPTATLPAATVQFLVPGDVAYAKCDCAKGHACEHVVLAVRAFRAGSPGVHTLGGAPPVISATSAVVVDAIEHLVRYGLVAPGSHAKLEQAGAAAERDRWWWIADGLEGLERLADAYRRQSTRFRIAALAREVGELVARLRASSAPGSPLPAAYLLGSDRAGDTAMEQVRLLALGARLDADGDRRMARLYFADPDTATVLVLDRTWDAEARVGADLGALFASSRMSIADLARGELVTRAARRRANGALDLGAARGMKSSLLPSSGSWAHLPEPLLVRDLEAHGARRAALPPSCLCPRGLGSGIAVVAIARVVEIDARRDGQSVSGIAEDASGTRLVVHTEHRSVSPGAVEATAAALGARPTHVAGELRRSHGGWSMEPIALMAPGLVVVDLHRPGSIAAVVAEAHREPEPEPEPAAARLAASIRDYVGRTLLEGARTTVAIASRLAADADRVFAHRLGALLARAATGDPTAITAILDLAVLHQLDSY